MGDFFSHEWVRAAMATGLALFVAQGIPRALRTLYTWTAAMLFGSIHGKRRLAAMVISGASLLWVLAIVQSVYTPLALLTPRIMPYPDGLIRQIILVEMWILFFILPVTIGITQLLLADGNLLYKLSMIPRAFLHTVGIAAALFTLIPWILWRFIWTRLTRWKAEQINIEIEPERYDSVADRLIAGLGTVGLPARTMPFPGPVRLSRWFLNHIGPPFLRPRRDYAARRIVGDGYSLMVFDGLIDIVALKNRRARVRVGLIGRLPPEGLWLTHSEDAREIERHIRGGGRLTDVPALMQEKDIPLPEWRILAWEYLQALNDREQAAEAALPIADAPHVAG